MPEKEPKVKLQKAIMDALVELVIQDIKLASQNPIPLALIHLAEKCLPIYKRFEHTYLNDDIDYSDTGNKKIKDIENAINKLRNLEVEKVMYTPKTSESVVGQVTVWRYPPVDGFCTILLTAFCDDVLSLTAVPREEIKIRLESAAIGIAPISEEGK